MWTLNIINNLGNLYADQGKMGKAEAMYLRALESYENVWGQEHMSTLNTINNLGNLYADQGKMEEAEAMFWRALKGEEDQSTHQRCIRSIIWVMFIDVEAR